jgi:dephospho-CoA kinase
VLRIGLTGGIASGKSAAADLFAAHGVTLIDTDVVARDVVAPGEPGLAAIAAEFGSEVLHPDGQLNRGALRTLVFADPAARRRLEALLHPLIRARTVSLMAAAEARNAGSRGTPEHPAYLMVVVPLLVETDFADLVDRVLVIDCPVETQLERLMARDNLTAAAARRMLEQQATRAERLARADDVINNTGALSELEQAVAIQHARYLQLAARPR